MSEMKQKQQNDCNTFTCTMFGDGQKKLEIIVNKLNFDLKFSRCK